MIIDFKEFKMATTTTMAMMMMMMITIGNLCVCVCTELQNIEYSCLLLVHTYVCVYVCVVFNI